MILTPNSSRRVFAYPAPVDLRKGYDGLFGLVEQGLRCDPMGGDLYLFVNESRKLCKILLRDGSGLCIFQKRLTLGTFPKIWRDDRSALKLTQRELELFIEGSTFFARRPAITTEKKRLFRIAQCDLREAWRSTSMLPRARHRGASPDRSGTRGAESSADRADREAEPRDRSAAWPPRRYAAPAQDARAAPSEGQGC